MSKKTLWRGRRPEPDSLLVSLRAFSQERSYNSIPVMRGATRQLLTIATLMLAVFALAQESARPEVPTRYPETYRELDSIVVERLAYYANAFPEISFVVLSPGDAWPATFRKFLALLGDQAQNHDYEHPSHSREDLLYVTKARVQQMLRAGESSSSLFRVGADSLAKREYLCAITINAAGIASDDDVATQHLLGVFREDTSHLTVQRNQRLDHRYHLEYVLDHEIFHCLDALYNRPIPMSSDERTTTYYHFLNENGADVFALAMHLQRHGERSEYPDRLSYIRGLSLFWGDPGHFTHDATRRFLERKNDDLKDMSVTDLLALAASIRDQVTPTFDDYVAYELAARAVAVVFRDESDLLCTDMRNPQAKDGGISITDRLLSLSCVCYTRVFGDSLQTPSD